MVFALSAGCDMDHTRNPLVTYEQALWRLVQWDVGGKHTAEQLSLAVQIVSDVFWLSDDKVRHDVLKKRRTLGAMPRPSAPRVSSLRHHQGVF